MLTFVKLAGVVGVFAVTMISGIGWWYAVSPPPPAHLSLPSSLLDARSEEGRLMLASTPFRGDYDLLSKYFVTQNRRGYCGVASGTIVLNALRPSAAPLSQELFFTKRATAVRSSVHVTLGGMTLPQLADLLRVGHESGSVPQHRPREPSRSNRFHSGELRSRHSAPARRRAYLAAGRLPCRNRPLPRARCCISQLSTHVDTSRRALERHEHD
jgi:Phytochelatin synthase